MFADIIHRTLGGKRSYGREGNFCQSWPKMVAQEPKSKSRLESVQGFTRILNRRKVNRHTQTDTHTDRHTDTQTQWPRLVINADLTFWPHLREKNYYVATKCPFRTKVGAIERSRRALFESVPFVFWSWFYKKLWSKNYLATLGLWNRPTWLIWPTVLSRSGWINYSRGLPVP